MIPDRPAPADHIRVIMTTRTADKAAPSLFALAAITALAPFALNVIVPSVPGLAEAFGTDYGTAQLAITAFLVAVALGQLVVGPLSDALGRRPVLLGGIAIFVAGSVLCAMAVSIEMLIAGRFIQAAGGCAGLVLGRAIVRDIYTRDRSASAIGYVTMVMALAPTVAPALGGVLDEWGGWSATFWVMFAGGIGLYAFAVRAIHETNSGPRVAPRISALAHSFVVLLGLRAFIFYTLTLTFTSALFFTFLASGPYITIELLGHSPTEYGVAFFAISFGYIAGNFTSGRLSTRVGTDRMMMAGCAVALLGVLVTGLFAVADATTIITLFGSFMLISYSNGLILPNAMASLVSIRPDLAGAAAGLSGFAQFAFAGAATLLMAELGASPMTMAAQMLILVVLAIACLMAVPRGGAASAPGGEASA